MAKNFIVLSAWVTDTSIFEVKTNKDNTFKSLEKVMLLRGEKGKITDASMDENGNRANIASKGYYNIYDQISLSSLI